MPVSSDVSEINLKLVEGEKQSNSVSPVAVLQTHPYLSKGFRKVKDICVVFAKLNFFVRVSEPLGQE